MVTLAVPETLDAKLRSFLAANLLTACTDPHVVIDFGDVRASEPFGLFFAGCGAAHIFHGA